MKRKLEEVKKDIKKLRANTTLSKEKKVEKFVTLDIELDELLKEKINVTSQDTFVDNKKNYTNSLGISFFPVLEVKNLC